MAEIMERTLTSERATTVTRSTIRLRRDVGQLETLCFEDAPCRQPKRSANTQKLVAGRRFPLLGHVRFFGQGLALATCLMAIGCGSGHPRMYPVEGKVFVNGTPAKDAVVVFHPLSQNATIAKMRPAGQTDATGSFRITCFQPNDGAPAGRYRVTIEWRKVAVDARTGKSDSGPDLLNGAYAEASKSPLEVTIDKVANALEPFNLQPSRRER